MVSIPDEPLEAARLDGAGEFSIFRKVVLPLSWPVVAVLTIFTFMWH
jgi:ABC-type glycerol-3-phosphate transport system permease component